ncbi:MAG: phosphonopyruvate decarboxylase [Clostridia bacterium]|nr:phosphonopyruvate decarboxylase [Clostridia bacterium]
MDAQHLLAACRDAGIDFFTGVPDSQLKGLCDTLYATLGVKEKHIVAANEGNAIGLCAGHFLATGRPALCYMQNSGLGNAVNPLASLMDAQVYAMPCLLVVGWRGEPVTEVSGSPLTKAVKSSDLMACTPGAQSVTRATDDEPQHVKQGQVTLSQLELLDVPYMVLDKAMTEADFDAAFAGIRAHLAANRTAAIVVKKGALTCSAKPVYGNAHAMTREEAVGIIARLAGSRDAFVSTTGKLSRELFELREAAHQGHERDFLTVGSMGHASMIALGIAMEQPERRIWCLDGDGAALMHLGAMAVIGQRQPRNLVHVVINNGAHETVGGMPVCEGGLDLCALAMAAGYRSVCRANSPETLLNAIDAALSAGELAFIEVMCAVGARADLGRPTTTPQQNRDALMAFLQQ